MEVISLFGRRLNIIVVMLSLYLSSSLKSGCVLVIDSFHMTKQNLRTCYEPCCGPAENTHAYGLVFKSSVWRHTHISDSFFFPLSYLPLLTFGQQDVKVIICILNEILYVYVFFPACISAHYVWAGCIQRLKETMGSHGNWNYG